MKKLLSPVKKYTCLLLLLQLTVAYAIHAQVQLWGMTSDGGSNKSGGNIFSIATDGTGFTERYAFTSDGKIPYRQSLLDGGDGFLYGAISDNIIYSMLPDGTGYQPIYGFDKATGTNPKSNLIKGLDGYLYGTTSAGGSNDSGVVYKVTTAGTGYTVLHHFTGGTDGKAPAAALLQLSNGSLFGVTPGGGNFHKGVIYKINPDGTGYSVVHHFTGTDGSGADAALITAVLGRTTLLYGVTPTGGRTNNGVIYNLNTDGNGFAVQFNFTGTNGTAPQGPLLKIGTQLYGVCSNGGGTGFDGVAFSFNPNVATYQLLHKFVLNGGATTERTPNGTLVNVNGVLYGNTGHGGIFQNGVLYKMNTDGTGYTVLLAYNNAAGFYGNLSFYNNQLYGLTVPYAASPNYKEATAYRLNTDGTGYQTIHSFLSGNGYGPSGSLIKALDGKLYGLTTWGGSFFSNGVAFSIQTDGTAYSMLQWLDNGPVAGHPFGSPVQATNGSFYGMNNSSGAAWAGTVFKLTNGTPVSYQQFPVFCLAPGCAALPTGSLMQATDGNLYGMAPPGGNGTDKGMLFRITTAGTGFTTVHSFNGTDGANPAGSLIQAADGFLYGMTKDGGSGNNGVIFKVRPDGTLFQTLFQFGPSTGNGVHPLGSLTLGVDFKLYGMAQLGGANLAGIVFRLNTNGTSFQVIHHFSVADGTMPNGSLVQDVSTGFLYGTTEHGGASNMGTVFKINPDGTTFQKLLDFYGSNGKYPRGDLLLVQTGGALMAHTETGNIAKDKSLTTLTGIMPNPAQHSFTVRLQTQATEKIALLLTDMQGRIIEQPVPVSVTGVYSRSFDISRLPAGIYLLRITTGGKVITQKIAKR